MRQAFENPTQYLNYLKEIYARPYTEGKPIESEFGRITHEQLRQAGVEAPSGPIGGIEYVINDLSKKIIASLDDTQRDALISQVAIGVVESGEPQAFIARSPDRKYAVLFYSGLALFLHKLMKLSIALVDPTSVTYCNRTGGKITAKQIKSYIKELITNYRETSIPRGPLIKLSMPANLHAATMLVMVETFVISHEIAHFLNGDLDDKQNYSALPYNAPGDRFEENKNHEMEHRADSVGFGIYRNSLASTIECPLEAWLGPIVFMFDTFYRISGGASSSHPHPYDRVIRIVRDHHGDVRSAQMEAALRDPRALSEFFNLPNSV